MNRDISLNNNPIINTDPSTKQRVSRVIHGGSSCRPCLMD